ncbi:N-6 DNA methylase [Nocardiopsis sp. MG754419]|uniref:N-6 DNA methylase n=1 Tax=Nocardiopsis sp. MG754419 TaxID=2259865 RepID=UPI001BAC967C|nr:N-6 DNA methylase [Nocardiopsis sp. MG754419]MBR8743512.1 N-6 DNA methylase [Nocardiopsis sp. MG754419]
MAESTTVTAADIARIAQVSRTTVSNWRRRHGDFPHPVGGSGNRSLFDLVQVEQWLARSDRMPEREPHERVWERVRTVAAEDDDLGEVVADIQELLLCLSRGGAAAEDGVTARVTGHPGGADLIGEVREAARTPERSRALSDRVHDAYLASLGGKAHITPDPLARLMADLAGVRGAEVLDPACGTGTLLRTASEDGAVGLYGQEVEEATARLAQARVGLVPSGAPGRVSGGDSLTADAFSGRLFDTVLCNLPFNQRGWGADELAYDERWAYGVPPRSESELAWIQHCLAHTRPGGRVVVLMPPAAASRPSGRRIRRELLRRGALSAVIGLPAGAAAPLHVGLHLWVLRQPETNAVTEPHVLFVDAGGELEGEEQRRAIDWEELHRVVGGAWSAFLDTSEKAADVPGSHRVASVVELLDDTVDLTPQRHLPVAASEATAEETHRWVGKTRRRLLRTLERVSSGVPGERWTSRDTGEWRMAAVADLARSGALILYRAPSMASGLSPAAEEGTGDGPRVLTLADVLSGREPSGCLTAPTDSEETQGRVGLHAGDVIVPSVLARRESSRARVTTAADAGAHLGLNLHLLRPDPAHIDPWFLAGFLEDEDNLRRAGQGSTVIRVDLRRLRVPLLSLAEQRRYGSAFRELHEFRTGLDRARATAYDLGRRLSGGLRSGLLAPPPPTESAESGGPEDPQAPNTDTDV